MERLLTQFAKALRPAVYLPLRVWEFLGSTLVNGWGLLLVFIYLFPMSFMIVTALKENAQFNDINAPLLPAEAHLYTYEGKEYPIYYVPTETGVQQWALVERKRTYSNFVDPNHPENGLINWTGNWRALKRVYSPHIAWGNLEYLWNFVDYSKLVRNSATIVLIGEVGVLISSILVAYGFARFRFPGSHILFIVMIASIMLPEKITLIPTYYLFNLVLHWGGTYYPLIVPLFFGNAVLIFFLRQNFKSIPKDIEEAAMLDGAGPLRTLVSIMLPQCIPAIVTAGLLHFFYAWNESRMASLYLASAPELYPVSFAVQQYQRYFPPPNMLQMSALLAMAVPVIVLFLSQRIFMRGVRVTGLEK